MTTAFVFPGQGTQFIGMGKDLAEQFETARHVFEEVDDALHQPLSRLMFEGEISELTQTQNAQPAIMAVSIAALKAYEEVTGQKAVDTARFVIGHSLGEYSALCAASALNTMQTAQLLQARGTAMQQAADIHPGAMAAVLGLDREEVSALIQDALTPNEVCVIANDNCPGQIVISGTKAALDKAVALAPAHGAKRAVLLPVSGAFHSPLMQSAADEMRSILQDAPIQNPIIPVIANVTACPVQEAETIKNLLTQQITGSVRFTESVGFLKEQGINRIVEFGPGKVLTGLIKRMMPDATLCNINSYESLKTLS